jgi:hypothetical protein
MGSSCSNKELSNTTMRDLQKAAHRFHQISLDTESPFKIAFIGGFAAKMMAAEGERRVTQGLDVLVESKFLANFEAEDSFCRAVFRKNREVLSVAEKPSSDPKMTDKKYSVVICHTYSGQGVPIKFIDESDEGMKFPKLEAMDTYSGPGTMPHPDSPMRMKLHKYKKHEIPVLRAPALIEQRLHRFCTQNSLGNEAKKRDVEDIRIFLDFAIRFEKEGHSVQRFDPSKVNVLLPMVKDMLKFARAVGIGLNETDERNWKEMNIDITKPDFRELQQQREEQERQRQQMEEQRRRRQRSAAIPGAWPW